jgi:diguanylate cyclase (GGDEF)-like protein/PAS domain S-box-containing protein
MLNASKASIIASTLIALIFAYLQSELVDSFIIIFWFSAVLLVALLRTVLIYFYQQFPANENMDIHARLNWFRISVLIAGLVFGSAGYLMFPSNDPQHQMFLIFLLAGLTAGSVASYSADIVSAMGFAVATLTPIIARLLFTGDHLSLAMGFAATIYLGFMIIVIRHSNRSLSENFSLRLSALASESIARTSEERYRLLLDHSPIGIFHFDTELVVTYCNDRYAHISHSTIEEIVGLDIKTLKDQSILTVMRNSLTGEICHFEGPTLSINNNPDGWIEVKCAPSRNSAGKIVGGIAIVRDISEQKRSAAAINLATQRLHIALESSQISLWETNLVTNEVWQDAAWPILLGYSTAQESYTTSAKLLTAVHQDDRNSIITAAVQTMKGEIASYTVEHRVMSAQGDWIWILSRGRVIERDNAGRPLLMSGTNTNISEQKKSQQNEEFRTQILELLTSENSLAVILETIVLGVEKLNSSMLCSILLLDKTGLHLGNGVAPSLPDFYNEALEGIEIGIGVGSCGTAAYSKERVIVEDIATHPYWAPYKELAAHANLGSCWSQPIFTSLGKVLGTFAIYHHEAHLPSNSDIAMIEQAAHLASIAIERKLVEEKLQKSEHQYRLLIETANEGILVAQGSSFKFVNQKTLEVTGFNKDELFARPFLELIHPEDRAAVGNNYLKRMRGELTDKRYQFRILTKFEGVKWVEMSGTKIEWEDEPASFNFITDISERKQAEDALRYSEQRFRDVSDASGEYVWEIDANLVYTYVSRQSTAVKGYSPEDLIGHTPIEFMPVEDIQSVSEIVNHAIASKSAFKLQHRDITHTGNVMWEEVSGIPFYNDQGEVIGLRGTGMNITERRIAEEEIHSLAFYDVLTKLPNRRLLMDRMHTALSVSARNHQYGSVLFLDMDRFKNLNDTQGHDYGDLLLVEVAKRIQSCVREIDTVARLGGDEFVILLDEIDGHAEEASRKVAMIAEKIRERLTVPYQLKDIEYHSSPSIGVSLYCGKEESAVALLKHADMAMYQAKESGRNAVRFFSPAMQLAVETHAALEADLRHAVTNHQLHLHYQIQVDYDGHALGAEALIRWIHPTRGMVSPAQFIPIAEETSLILEIGNWVLDTACRQLSLWKQREMTRELTIAVNVSAQQFKQHDFVATIATALRIHNIEAAQLKLELTESVVLNDVKDVVAKMHALKALGVGLSLDDFGTGYSSLSYLKQLPLDQIKIDQSFVRDIATDPNDAVMVQTIIDLAKNFRLNVIAEGVETDIQLGFLRAHGCMAYQGYFFSKPVAIDQLEALLKKS